MDECQALLVELENNGNSWRANGPEIHGWQQRVRNLIRSKYSGAEQDSQLEEFNAACNYRSTIPVKRRNENPDIFNDRDKIVFLIEHMAVLCDDIPTEEELTEEKVTLLLRPKIFITHGGPSKPRDKLESFIRALGAEPIIAEESASRGRSIRQKVHEEMENCHYCVILATSS